MSAIGSRDGTSSHDAIQYPARGGFCTTVDSDPYTQVWYPAASTALAYAFTQAGSTAVSKSRTIARVVSACGLQPSALAAAAAAAPESAADAPRSATQIPSCRRSLKRSHSSRVQTCGVFP